MLEFLHQLSDNQVALLGCVGAVSGAILLLTISFHANPENRIQAGQSRPAQADQTIDEITGQDTQRRAA